jgi:catechol 2,3-dioxygenase-like lactoylglutathione lyase family enzyme
MQHDMGGEAGAATRAAPGIAGYAHVNVIVDDIDAARAFYERKLGLERLARPDFGGFGGEWYRVGPVQLHLSVADRMPDWNGTAPHLALYIPADEFVDTVRGLEAAGVELTSDIRVREDFGVAVQTAFCRDPAGNLIELTDVAPFA